MGVTKMKTLFYRLLIILCASRVLNSKSINYKTYCSSGYTLVPNTTMCALITTNATSHKNVCLNTGQTDPRYYEDLVFHRNPEQLIEYLQFHGVTGVWLPIAKNSLNLLVWKLPLPVWNSWLVDVGGSATPKHYTSGDCVLYLVDKNELIMENCETVHRHLCVYDQTEKNYAISSLCNEITVTPRISKYHGFCFEIERLDSIMPHNKSSSKISFVDSEDKLVAIDQLIWYHQLMSEAVQIATNFFSNIPRGYVTALRNSVIDIVDQNFVFHRVVEKNIVSQIHNYLVTIQVMYDPISNELIVNIRNYRFLWTVDIREYSPVKCHTDASLETDTVKTVKENRTKIEDNLHISMKLPLYVGIANYWCEGQKLSTFESIQSNRVTVLHKHPLKDTFVLSVYADRNCQECNFYNVIYNFRWKKPDFKQLQSGPTDLENVQLKKILSISNNTISVLLHVVVVSKPLDRNTIKDYERFLKSELTEYNITEIRAMDTCFSQNLNHFNDARLNEISVFKLFCLMDTGLPAIQKCIGNQFDGAYWERVYNTTTILENCETSLMSEQAEEFFMLNQELRALNKTNQNDERAKSVIEQIVGSVNRVITMENNKLSEIQYAAITLNNLFENSKIDVFNVMGDGNISTILDPVTEIIDTLFEMETHPLIKDPNRILGSIDALAMKYAESHVTNKIFLDSNDGVVLIQKANIILMIVNPAIKNISGIALYKKNKNDIDLNDFTVRKLQGHEKAVHIYNKSLELSAQIPTEWLAKLQINKDGHMRPPNRLIFKIFYKHSLFDESQVDPDSGDITETVDTDSKIISISVSNYTGFEATHGLFAMFRTKFHVRRSKPLFRGCSDFSSTLDSPTKRWNRDFTKFENLDDSIVVCPVNRLSNIGFVKLFGNKIVTDKQTRIFIVISHYTTIIGCALSGFGLVMIFLTAIFYEKWKRREATPLVLNISVATFLQITMFGVAESQIFTSSVNCLLVGGVLHYFTLVTLFISLFVADCQYRRYILVFGPATTSRFKIKMCIFGWLTPLLIVAGCVVMQPNSYIPSEEFHDLGGICYPTNIILQCFVHFPIVVVFCINSSVYGWIIFRLIQEDPSLRKTPRKSIIVAQTRLFCFIFMVLSLPWIFGLIAHYTELYAFSFLFNLLAPLQGFSLFIFCCLADIQTRKFWLKCKLCKT